MQAMTFRPRYPDITKRIGNVTIRLYSGPEHYVSSTDGTAVITEAFMSRWDAEHHLAQIIAKHKGYDAFFAGRDCKPPVLTDDLAAAWVDGWQQAQDVGRSMLMHDWQAEECHGEWQPEYSIEDDHEAMRRW